MKLEIIENASEDISILPFYPFTDQEFMDIVEIDIKEYNNFIKSKLINKSLFFCDSRPDKFAAHNIWDIIEFSIIKYYKRDICDYQTEIRSHVSDVSDEIAFMVSDEEIKLSDLCEVTMEVISCRNYFGVTEMEINDYKNDKFLNLINYSKEIVLKAIEIYRCDI